MLILLTMKTFESFAKDIGLNLKMLDNYITYADRYYNTFYIKKKKKGKMREIDCPSRELKAIQRWLLTNYFSDIPVSKRAFGFVKNKGIKHNASLHLNKDYILSIDIKDFFPSISQKKVYESLEKYIDDDNLRMKIAKLCTYKQRLPQGSPTSPILSNITFKEIDDIITSHCNSQLVVYTRYADDLVFSCDTKNTLSEVYSFVNKILAENSFEINKCKTKFLSGKGRMSVTGINLNSGKLTVSRNIKRNLRSALYRYIVNNDKSINVNSLLGYLSFIRDIEPNYYAKTVKYISLLRGKKRQLSLTSRRK